MVAPDYQLQKPDFTAWLMIGLVAALKSSARWRSLVPEENYPIYDALLKRGAQSSLDMRLLLALPDGFKTFFMDRFIVRGMTQHLALRKRLIEQQISQSVREQGIRQLVVIGAGFDIVALRLARAFPALQAIELDLPATQALKCEVLKAVAAPLPTNLHYIPCDLSTTPLQQVLREQCPAFNPALPTLFVAEGLTMHLTAQENATLFSEVSRLCSGATEFIFTAIEKIDDGSSLGEFIREHVLKSKGSAFKWGIPRAQMAGFCQTHGLTLEWHKDFADIQKDIRSEKELAVLRAQSAELVYFAKAAR